MSSDDTWFDNFKTVIMKFFKLSCEDTSPLISESMDHTLSFPNRLRLKIHLFICGMCQCYQKQLRTIQELARCLGKEDNEVQSHIKLSPERKEQIRNSLKTP